MSVSVRAAASRVKASSAETVAASAPQKRKPIRAELAEERREGRDGPRVGAPVRRALSAAIACSCCETCHSKAEIRLPGSASVKPSELTMKRLFLLRKASKTQI
jgi:hypothetical protein